MEVIPEAWYRADADDNPASASLRYRPAILVECSVNFRSLRAGLNHSEERNYTAWLPQGDLAVDWDCPAVEKFDPGRLASSPDPSITFVEGSFHKVPQDFDQYESELVDKLVRNKRLKLFFNPVFGIFSSPGEALEDFMPHVGEAALARVEPELMRLRTRFELQLEQVREAQISRGSSSEDLNTEWFISRKLHFFASENRLADMFSNLAGSVFGSKEVRVENESCKADEWELREDLERLEQEAGKALRTVYDEYLASASEYDVFEIGLQPDNIQVVRRMLLWVPGC
ncbi:MAG TPA: hypothetical protein VKM94_15200 [Blastocatellia bacterium]|nr:hypothetical protein [Blastocatellia bacterium]